MDSLVLCPCGHGIERHAKAGCPGERTEHCGCTLTARAALDAAVEAVKYVGPPRGPDGSIYSYVPAVDEERDRSRFW